MIRAEQTRGETSGSGISARVVLYPRDGEPEITEVAAANSRTAATKFTRLVVERVKEAGGRVPEVSVREVVENLVHAHHEGVIISVLDGGNVVRVSDKGPGIQDKGRAMEFGFSGASSEALGEIRGVGAGLGIARSAAEQAGGKVILEDNIGGGVVATISVPSEAVESAEPPPSPTPSDVPRRRYPDGVPRMNLSERQQKVLITVLESGEVGPSTVADLLEISVSTAYRDLSVLEEDGLVVADEGGKRLISPLGKDLVGAIINDWVR